MRAYLPDRVEMGRFPVGTEYGSPAGVMYGAFLFFSATSGERLKVISTGRAGRDLRWEHVSVSCETRCPTWEEMCEVKDYFWGDEETVVQFHPPKSKYVNVHQHCLHLWKDSGKPFALPPTIMV